MVVPEGAQVLTDDWVLRLMQGGVVVSLHVGRWGGKTRLKADDLGIRMPEDPDARAVVQEFLQLGEKYLLPRQTLKRLESIETLARQNLTACSIQTVFGAFVPAGTWQRFQERHEALKADYFAVRDEIVAKLDEIRAQVQRRYETMAHVAWRRLQRRAQDDPTQAPEEFVAEYVARVMAAFPAADYIHASFRFEAIPTYIPLPTLLAEDRARAEEIRRAEWEKAEAEREEAWSRLQQQREADQQQRAMQAEVARYWKEQQRELIDGFLADMVGQVRGQVYGVVSSALETLERNEGKLPGKTAQGLQTLIETIRAIDPYGDTELEVAFQRLRGQLERPAPFRDGEEIRGQLDALCTITRASLVALDRAPRGSREELALPTLEEERQARARLGIVDVAVPAVVAEATRRARSL